MSSRSRVFRPRHVPSLQQPPRQAADVTQPRRPVAQVFDGDVDVTMPGRRRLVVDVTVDVHAPVGTCIRGTCVSASGGSPGANTVTAVR